MSRSFAEVVENVQKNAETFVSEMKGYTTGRDLVVIEAVTRALCWELVRLGLLTYQEPARGILARVEAAKADESNPFDPEPDGA